jgi:hypothetical protein
LPWASNKTIIRFKKLLTEADFSFEKLAKSQHMFYINWNSGQRHFCPRLQAYKKYPGKPSLKE